MMAWLLAVEPAQPSMAFALFAISGIATAPRKQRAQLFGDLQHLISLREAKAWTSNRKHSLSCKSRRISAAGIWPSSICIHVHA